MRTIFIVFLFSLGIKASEITWPILDAPVVDEMKWILPHDKTEIEKLIRKTYERGQGQIQVLVVSDLQGLPIESYSIQLMEKWKMGDKKRDDGVLFLVSAKDRKMRIEVGQGLEGTLTDLKSKRILDDKVKPLFKSKNYSSGIYLGVWEITNSIAQVGQVESAHHVPPEPSFLSEFEGFFRSPLFLTLVILLLLFLNSRNRNGRGRYHSNNYNYSSSPNWSGGSYGGGSGGGSDWSGGGGGFSGGGASSDW